MRARPVSGAAMVPTSWALRTSREGSLAIVSTSVEAQHRAAHEAALERQRTTQRAGRVAQDLGGRGRVALDQRQRRRADQQRLDVGDAGLIGGAL